MASICSVDAKDGGAWLRGPPQNQRCSATAELTSASFAKKMFLLHKNGFVTTVVAFSKAEGGLQTSCQGTACFFFENMLYDMLFI